MNDYFFNNNVLSSIVSMLHFNNISHKRSNINSTFKILSGLYNHSARYKVLTIKKEPDGGGCL